MVVLLSMYVMLCIGLIRSFMAADSPAISQRGYNLYLLPALGGA